MDNFCFNCNEDGVDRGYKTLGVCITQCKNHLRRAYEYSCGNSVDADIYQIIRKENEMSRRKLLGTIRFDGDEFTEEAAE